MASWQEFFQQKILAHVLVFWILFVKEDFFASLESKRFNTTKNGHPKAWTLEAPNEFKLVHPPPQTDQTFFDLW